MATVVWECQKTGFQEQNNNGPGPEILINGQKVKDQG